MQCEGVEQRINELLDQRQNLSSDVALRNHVRACGKCRDRVATYDLMLDAVDAFARPEPPAQLPEQVVAGLNRNHLIRKPWVTVGVPFAVAATLLIAATLLFVRGRTSPTQPLATAPLDGSHSQDQIASEDVASRQEADVELDPFQQQYLAVWRMTGEAMAVLPHSVLQLSAEPDPSASADQPVPLIGSLSEGIRPLTNSLSVAFTALRHTLPTKSDKSDS